MAAGHLSEERIPTTGQVVLRIVIIISVAEMVIMLLFDSLQLQLDSMAVALLDGLLLVALSTLPIYLWVIMPFANAHERSTRHVAHLAYHDALTKLPNRRLLFEHLGRALAACRRHRVHGAVLLVDLDGFKQVNDAHGHDAGDALLREIGHRLATRNRQEDIVGRMGGDEFLVLAQQLDADREAAIDKAEAIAHNLQLALAVPVDFAGESLQVGSSIGIRMLGPEPLTSAEAVRAADEAMYLAKRGGPGDVVVHGVRRPTPLRRAGT
jgi:diguanylate cyclase (GGDEF)-like protein